MKACNFTSYKQEEKTIVKVYLEIGEDFAKTMEYVMAYSSIRASRSVRREFYE